MMNFLRTALLMVFFFAFLQFQPQQSISISKTWNETDSDYFEKEISKWCEKKIAATSSTSSSGHLYFEGFCAIDEVASTLEQNGRRELQRIYDQVTVRKSSFMTKWGKRVSLIYACSKEKSKLVCFISVFEFTDNDGSNLELFWDFTLID